MRLLALRRWAAALTLGAMASASHAAVVFLTTPSSDIFFEATSAAGAVGVFNAPTAAGTVAGGPLVVTSSHASGATFGLGMTTVVFSATDADGSGGSYTMRLHVIDTTPPVLSGMPTDIVTQATSGDGAIVDFVMPTASDRVNGAVPVTASRASGSLFGIGSHFVVFTAYDVTGNSASAMITVTVQPPTAGPVPEPGSLALAGLALALALLGGWGARQPGQRGRARAQAFTPPAASATAAAC